MSILIFILLFSVACERVKEVSVIPPPLLGSEPTADAPAVVVENISVANVALESSSGEKISVTVEIASTPEERRKGLQGRETMDDGYGMWVFFPEVFQDPFWMKDPPISLDIFFFDSTHAVADFFENTIPNSETLLTPQK